MKKLNKINLIFIIACIVLIVTYIVQLTAYKKASKRYTEVIEDGKEYTISDAKYQVEGKAAVYPRNIREFMEKYKGNYEYSDIGVRLFKFINEDVNEIYKATNNKNEEEIKKEYDQNTSISEMNIESADDFVKLCKQINILKEAEKNNKFKESEFDIDTLASNNYYTKCVLNIYYDKNCRIAIRLDVPNSKDNPIKIENYNELSKIFDSYAGPVTEKMVEDTIDSYRKYGYKQLNEQFNRSSIRDIKAFYNKNKEFINSYKVYSEDDLVALSYEINAFEYHSSTVITYYTVEKATDDNKAYDVYNIKFRNSDSDGTGTFKFYLAKTTNVDPVLKVGAEERILDFDNY